MDSFYLFDWVSFTTKYRTVNEIQKLLGLGYISWEQANGAHGYKDRAYFEKISIHYNGNYDTVWCEMTGQGCRAFETYGTGDYNALFKELTKEEDIYNVTRLDIAFDDHEGLLDIDRIFIDTMDENNYVSKSRECEYIGGTRGKSIYHGRKGSNTMIRIYDKAKEQHKEGHWIRTELQLRKENAHSFMIRYLEDSESINNTFLGSVHNFLRYVDPGTDTNRWRWPMKPYWKKFIDGAEKVKLYKKPGVEYNLGNLETFVIRQAGKAVKAYVEIYGQDFYHRIIDEKYPRLGEKYDRLIKKNKEFEDSFISVEDYNEYIYQTIERNYIHNEEG